MRSFTLISSLILLILSAACTSTGDDVTSPALPNLLNEENDLDHFVWECRANMRTIASQAVIFFATNDRYPNTLEEMGMAGVMCPGCGLTYQLGGTETVFYVGCPMPLYPNHGYIDDGVSSWQRDPAYEEYLCQGNMESIASQVVIFFADNNRYPESLEELGTGSYKCPTCGLSYSYYTYEDFAANPAYYIGCPISSDPNHGFIDNGVPSWLQGSPGQNEYICHGNMITIACQAAIFFACNGRYPRDLGEIGMAAAECPACGLIYEFTGTETEFYVACPMPTDPSHGYIDDGIASWLGEN